MKIGIVLPHHEIGTDTGALKAFATGAESLGADHLLLYDHVLGAERNRPGGFEGPYDKDVRFREPFTTFAFLAGATTAIELVTAVLILPQRQTALVAKQAAEIALLSDNRFRLGIGTGWNAVEYEALGQDFHTRGRRQSEQVELLRRYWAEETFSFEGEFDRVTLAGINPRPTQSIPIWFGGGAPALISRCARLGDGWFPLMGPNDAAKEILANLKATREDAGLSWDSFGVQAQAQAAGGTPERWHTHFNKWRDLGATHIALAPHNAGARSVDEHLKLFEDYLAAVKD